MTFHSRHQAKDEGLPEARARLLDAALEDLKGDPDVLGVYLAGSLAKGNYDAFSDIDLHILVSRESLPAFVAAKKARPERWGKVLFIEDASPGAADGRRALRVLRKGGYVVSRPG